MISIVLAILASFNSIKAENLWIFITSLILLGLVNIIIVLIMIRDIILGQLEKASDPIKV